MPPDTVSPSPLDVTFVTTCKGRLAHLKQTLPRLSALPGAAVVVVDYDCPDGAGRWVRGTYPSIRVVDGPTGAEFNRSHARNLGAAAATTDWLFFIDADTLADPALVHALRPLLASRLYLIPKPITAFGAIVLERRAFVRSGGYDELFQGWGGEDDEFKHRLTLMGLRPATFPGALLSDMPHGNAERMAHHAIGDIAVSQATNLLYKNAKLDLLRMAGPIDEPTRRSLYAACLATVRGEHRGDPIAPLDVGFRENRVGPWRLQASLTYRLMREDDE